ncbi:MAG: hypothetical protein ACI84R_000309 [Candidatus Azotimanducaceae bacterium]|jgi:hypothetical protein
MHAGSNFRKNPNRYLYGLSKLLLFLRMLMLFLTITPFAPKGEYYGELYLRSEVEGVLDRT